MFSKKKKKKDSEDVLLMYVKSERLQSAGGESIKNEREEKKKKKISNNRASNCEERARHVTKRIRRCETSIISVSVIVGCTLGSQFGAPLPPAPSPITPHRAPRPPSPLCSLQRVRLPRLYVRARPLAIGRFRHDIRRVSRNESERR